MKKIDNKNIRNKILSKYKNRCAYCGCELTIETLFVDHIEPLRRHIKESKSHLNVIENFNPSCKSCNSCKGSMNPEKWKSEIMEKHKRLLRDNSTYRLLIRMGILKVDYNNFSFYFEK